jgi:hypothetical protein
MTNDFCTAHDDKKHWIFTHNVLGMLVVTIICEVKKNKHHLHKKFIFF